MIEWITQLGRRLLWRGKYSRCHWPHVRVDPDRFSYEEYPVVCTKCGYQLRGLPDGQCPECGASFSRGRLLVEQYVLEPGGPGRRRLRRIATRFLVAGFLMPMFLGPFLMGASWLAKKFPALVAPVMFSRYFFLLSAVAVLLSVVLMMVSFALNLKMFFEARSRKRMRCVFDAIEDPVEGSKHD